MREGFRTGFPALAFDYLVTPWVKRLLFANVAMYLVTMVFPAVANLLVLVPAWIPYRPWTVVTYMFLHAGLWHLAFNMLGLYFFGPRLEARLGSERFLALYFISGISGALLSLATPHAAILGASAAVFGVFVGFARYWPRDRIYIWGLVPVEARVLVIALTALAIFGGMTGGGRIAHFAHLGGFAGGFLYLKWSEAHTSAARFRALAERGRKPSAGEAARWRAARVDQLHPINREEYERLMRKIAEEGTAALTSAERAFLDRLTAT
jgi:membrane associated rhomboid family serine protease